MNSVLLGSILCMLAGYLIGTLNPSFLIARMRGFDIREQGSGNAGASNAVITMGKAVGLIAALFDIFKAYFAVRLARHFFPNLTYAAELAGIFTILGHIFPFTMGFRGGKGLASLGGVILAFNAKVFWIILSIEVALALILDYIVVVPITASISFPIVYYFLTGHIVGTLLYAALIPIFIYRHLENFRRIRDGVEAHLSYLWNKDAEIERIMHQMEGKQ